jgi:toxin YoeB
MKKVFSDRAWTDYLYWQTQDKKTLRRINELIQSIDRNPFEGIGKPEALRGNLSGWWSRRIDQKNRLVYKITNDDELKIAQLRHHY